MSVNKVQFSLVGQNFSWLEQVGHKLEQQEAGRQRARNLRNAVRKICVKIECKPFKGHSKTTKKRKENDNNEQETSEMQFEDFVLKTNVLASSSRSKAKSKPRRRTPASSSTRTVPIRERIWTDVEPGEYSISDHEVSKKLMHLLRHGSLLRENDGAIEIWRIKDDLQKYFLHCHHWSDDKWK